MVAATVRLRCQFVWTVAADVRRRHLNRSEMLIKALNSRSFFAFSPVEEPANDEFFTHPERRHRQWTAARYHI
jgi:hypothetical protein